MLNGWTMRRLIDVIRVRGLLISLLESIIAGICCVVSLHVCCVYLYMSLDVCECVYVCVYIYMLRISIYVSLCM